VGVKTRIVRFWVSNPHGPADGLFNGLGDSAETETQAIFSLYNPLGL
jgi:hypothetical protein